MRRGPVSQRILIVQLLVLAAALGFLAVMQYRWIDQLADAERVRVREEAQHAADRAASKLILELRRTFEAFAGPDDADVPARYADWKAHAPEPQLIESLCAASHVENAWPVRCFTANGNTLAEQPNAPEGERLQSIAAAPPQPDRPPLPPPILPTGLAMCVVHGMPRAGPDGPPAVHQIIMIHFRRTAIEQMLANTGGSGRMDAAILTARRLAAATPGWRGSEAPARGDGVASIRAEAIRRPQGGRHPADPRAEWIVLARPAASALDGAIARSRWHNAAFSVGVLAIVAESVIVILLLLRRSNRLREQQTAFVTMVTHELNTPVAVIRASAENLRDGLASTAEETAAYAVTIIEEADQLRAMVEDVLTLAAAGARRRTFTDIDISSVVSAAVERCEQRIRAAAVEVDVNLEPALPRVNGDVQSLRRAVENLILNAVRYGASGGWIGVRAARELTGVAITVADNGPGIDPLDAPSLFEPFRRGSGTERVDGTGLGLTIVRQIAEQHGGRVTLDPRGRGASFTIHLPAVGGNG